MKQPIPIQLLVLLSVVLAGSTAVAGAQAPQDRTYFVYLMGLNDDPYEVDADCLTFNATQACSIDDEFCLTWQRTEGGLQTRKESGFSFTAEIDEEGLVITLEGQGRLDTHGRKSSISISAHASALGQKLNFIAAGRQVRRNRCGQLVEDFYGAQSAAH